MQFTEARTTMNEPTIRFYLACVLTYVPSKQVEEAVQLALRNPNFTLEAISKTARAAKVDPDWREDYYLPRVNFVLGDEDHPTGFNLEEFRLIWQEVKNYFVINTYDEATGISIRNRYFAGLVAVEGMWVDLVWILLDRLQEEDKKTWQALWEHFCLPDSNVLFE